MKRASTRNVVLSKAMKHVDEETRREFREKRLQGLECDNYVEMESAQQDDDAYNESEDDEAGGNKRKRAKTKQKGNNTVRSKWATRPVRSLERILLDNGIVRGRYEIKPTATTAATSNINNTNEDMDLDINEEELLQDGRFDYQESFGGGSSGNSAKKSGKGVAPGRISSSTSLAGKGVSKSRNISSESLSYLNQQEGGGDEEREVNYHTIAARKSAFPPRQCFCSVCGFIGNYACTRCGSKLCSIKCNESHKETRCFKFSM